ncbi:MAG: Response regulator receiver protein [Candidatus Uhrbacteria bacterium GW2011_GWE2_40_58]|nr:MAG: Response regulator receiver protein [Candidatus Uhrbacteria bacterium GW2011_GWF2_40_263]KKR67889.1 MAG: Response regulator receiver protein [Candidatus Uhrbacteria bacterium GW2011_GWE2_40_58]OGL93748.1 MAG: hypothetical protein A2239_00860 [Candidatus Uhrbacteria bacterium RIFOXYA2_FULL_40_9]OGL96858.1 MAG: hypothetical protein A2332_01940 [Candidatus Uhrbacteria bacterium RIFOXYB2_FULL_41_18]HBK34546.1 hypothetical protein [Candidatus Uhrbacteria bacterium]
MSCEKPLIMVVEDEANLLKAIVKKLEIKGFEAISFSDGESALAYLESGKSLPCFIWLDHYLPGMNGDEVLEQIKKNSDWKDITVFVVTNTSTKEYYEPLLEEGAIDFFVKAEVSLEDIIELIQKRIHKK